MQREKRLSIIGITLGLGLILALGMVTWGQRSSTVDAQNTAIAESNARATAQKQSENDVGARSIAQEREQAQRQIALSRSLAEKSRILFLPESQLFTGLRDPESNNSIVSILLAIESTRRNPTFEGIQSLIAPLASLPQIVAKTKYSGDGPAIILTKEDANFSRIFVSPDKTRVFKLGQISQTEYVVNTWDTNIWKKFELTKIIVPEETGLYKYSVIISKNTKWLIFVGDDGIEIQQTGSDSAELLWNTKGPFSSLQFSADSKRILAAKQDGTIKVWDTASISEISTIFTPTKINLVSFSNNGNMLIAEDGYGDNPNNVYIYDIKSGKMIGQLSGVYLGGDTTDNFIALSNGSNDIRIWNTLDNSEESVIGNECFLISVPISEKFITAPNLENVCNTDNGNFLRIWNYKTQKQLYELALNGEVRAYSINDTGDFATISAGDTVYFLDLVKMNVITKIKSDFTIDLLAVSPDKAIAAIANRDPLPVVGGAHSFNVIIVNIKTGEIIGRIPHASYITIGASFFESFLPLGHQIQGKSVLYAPL